jgi:hypothetical protein
MSKRTVLILSLGAAICALIGRVHVSMTSERSLPPSEFKPTPERQTFHSRVHATRNQKDAGGVHEETEDPIAPELTREIQDIVSAADPERLEFVYTNLLPALVSRDALAATRLAGALDDAELRDQFLRRVVRMWTAQDAPSALSWIEQLTDRTARDSAASDACLVIAQTNPEEAVQSATRLGMIGDAVIESLAQQWAAKDFPTALEWARAQRVPGERDKILARLAYVQSEFNPQSAAHLVAGEMQSGPIQTEAAIAVLHQWALRDFAGAAQWIERFPEGELRERAKSELSGLASQRLTSQ